jgi:hypothetical protein
VNKISIPPSYYHIKDHNLIICTTPRVASSSMSKLLSGRIVISQGNALSLQKTHNIMMWMRDPLERLACAFALDMNRAKTFPQFASQVTYMSNRHWIPQTTLHSFNGVLVPTIIYPFGALLETWPAKVGILPHERKSKNRKTWDDLEPELTENQLRDILKYYEADIKLYREIS